MGPKFSWRSRGGARLPERLYDSSEKAARTYSMGNLDPGVVCLMCYRYMEHSFLVE